jgi:AcrR family transcriptional regulator
MSILQRKLYWQRRPKAATIKEMTERQRSETPAGGLRERKRTRTRLMIQAEALRLFAEKGYAETTVEEIAEAAAISPRTFFRYFPSKEDVVVWDEYDDPSLELFQARPADEPLAEKMRVVIREALAGLYHRDPERLLTRFRLAVAVPELRARFYDAQRDGVELLASIVQPRGAADTLRLRVIGSALLAAVMVAGDRWQETDGKSDLIALLDEATDVLAEGMQGLESSRDG